MEGNNNPRSRPSSFVLQDNNAEQYTVDSNGHSCNDPKKRKQKKVKWSGVWYDFTQHTSFLGVKQVAEPQPFLARRLIWLLIFLCGTIVFLIQVGFSIKYYLAWPVSVDVKIKYNKTINFPAVTVCNANAFRATEAYRLGQYELITELFTQHRDSPVDVQLYNASAISLEQLYLQTKHDKEDLIFKCEWDSSSCSARDFTTTLTDFGVCYTFNGGPSPRTATQTGAQGGLRLQLNIEQYEYMKGPNDGAGVKLLVHQPNDIPLVKEHGLAVPSGMHGFVALEILEVHNLKPPHGKCNDSVVLEHFEHYTMSTCAINCKEKHLEQQCGCRDIYMPPTNVQQQQKQHDIPMCDLQTFQTCMKAQLEEYHQHVQQSCECPVPCARVMFEPTVTYVSTSNFDIDNLLGSNITDILEIKYVRAREASQRTNANTARQHNALVHDLLTITESIDGVFSQVTTNIKKARKELDDMMRRMEARTKFHLLRGLNNVNFIMEHDFIRGWQVYEERVFNYVSSDYENVPESVSRTLAWMNNTFLANDTYRKEASWWPVKNMIEGKLLLIKLARINVTTAHNAYQTGEPLLTYELTLNRRYDVSYISLELLQKGARRQQEYFDALMTGLEWSEAALRWMLRIGDNFIANNTYSDEEFLAAKNLYHKGCRAYNYRLFLFKDRIILKPLKYIARRITAFEDTTKEMMAAYVSLQTSMDIVLNLIDNTKTSNWKNIHNLLEEASEYERDLSRNKTHLAQVANSVKMAEDLRQLKIKFSAMRSRAQDVSDNWRRMSAASEQVWINMVSETSTKAFYEMIYNDFTQLLSSSAQSMFYMIFADLLSTNQTKLQGNKPEDFAFLLNADFHTLNLTEKLIQVHQEYVTLENSCEVNYLLRDKDEVFLQSLDKLQVSLQHFLNQNVMNHQFYRENFLQLDVFMQELSYEEITQQPAYDLPQLLGDIGGSMGLFIGGSALSVFEFFDVILHNGARLLFNR